VNPAYGLLVTVELFGALALSIVIAWLLAKRIMVPSAPNTPNRILRIGARAVVLVVLVFFLEPTLFVAGLLALEAIGIHRPS
jgi:hypothetical protein